MAEDVRTYSITISGFADQGDLDAASPVEFQVDCTNEGATIISACTDQSGLIGLIRHLHGLGLVLVSVQASDKA